MAPKYTPEERELFEEIFDLGEHYTPKVFWSTIEKIARAPEELERISAIEDKIKRRFQPIETVYELQQNKKESGDFYDTFEAAETAAISRSAEHPENIYSIFRINYDENDEEPFKKTHEADYRKQRGCPYVSARKRINGPW
jgi:hypothetical protein